MKDHLIQMIERDPNKRIDYHTFMETCLYKPGIGYYAKEETKLGREGDFYTSNHVHPVFPKTIMTFIVDVIKKEKLSPNIIEFGGGDGTFALHALSYVKQTDPDLYQTMNYSIVETSEHHKKVITEALKCHQDIVSVVPCLGDVEVGQREAIVFSNELVDAFPVHVVSGKKDGSIEEVCITVKDGELEEVTVPCEHEEVLEWISSYGPSLPEGHRTEVSVYMRAWIQKVAAWLEKGLVVTIDYGYSNDEKAATFLRDGSLRGYKNHRQVRNPLAYPGEMDLTAHIQWDAYRKIMKETGFEEVVHERQSSFLLKAGLFTFLLEVEHLNPFSDKTKQNRAIATLVQPGGISDAFEVNVQSKGLSGYYRYDYFTRDPYNPNLAK